MRAPFELHREGRWCSLNARHCRARLLEKPAYGLLVRSHFGGEEAIKPAALPALLA
jgi:hypothetical protein